MCGFIWKLFKINITTEDKFTRIHRQLRIVIRGVLNWSRKEKNIWPGGCRMGKHIVEPFSEKECVIAVGYRSEFSSDFGIYLITFSWGFQEEVEWCHEGFRVKLVWLCHVRLSETIPFQWASDWSYNQSHSPIAPVTDGPLSWLTGRRSNQQKAKVD